MAKEYIGDGYYVDSDGYGLILTAEADIKITNVIYLEPHVYSNLLLYVDRERVKQSSEENTHEIL